MELIVTQMLEEGILGGPKNKSLYINSKNLTYDIDIEQQYGMRKILICSSNEEDNYKGIYEIYRILITLLMLFDGNFIPIKNVYMDELDVTEDWIERTLPRNYSADFLQGTGNILLDYDKVLDEQIFYKWSKLKEKLDIIHNMVLYCLSDVKMPKDVQCAFMVEVFEGLSELIELEKPEIKFFKAKKGESQLQKNIIVFIDNFGKLVFDKEIKCSLDIFAKRLVCSRNRIAHIKREQKESYLVDGENVIYLMKLSLLYRVVLLDLLDISEGLYKNRLMARVQYIDNSSVMQEFLKKLEEDYR